MYKKRLLNINEQLSSTTFFNITILLDNSPDHSFHVDKMPANEQWPSLHHSTHTQVVLVEFNTIRQHFRVLFSCKTKTIEQNN
jgi:hypothetical protein